MGVCLSKGGHAQQQQGPTVANEDEGFCTPEGVSSQYESPNPSGRYSFAQFETPRMSADVGDLGALGSLFYKRGSRSRGEHTTATTTTTAPAVSNYISPLDMFLGGVSGRNRVHHVNQICTGDYSFASYLASPLLKGFDVHAMEAVAKSYAESAAKAAARDTFVFLEENDISVMSSSFQGAGVEGDCPPRVSTSSAVDLDDGGDVDDDLAKSGESEDWEEPRKADNWEEAQKSHQQGTTDRWDSVLNAVQARAKARRRQRRKSNVGKGQGLKEKSSIGGGKKKTVRFRLGGVEEGFTDDDIRSGKESEYEQALETLEAEILYESGEATPASVAQHPRPTSDDCVEYLDRSEEEETGTVAEAAAAAEEERDYYLWQDEGGGGDDGGGEGNCYGEEEIVEAEFSGFVASQSAELSGGAMPIVGPPPPAAVDAAVLHVHHPSLESFSSSEYFLPDTSFGSSEQEEEVVDLAGLPPGVEDDDDEATSSGNHGAAVEEEEEEDGRQCRPADFTFDESSPGPSGGGGGSSMEQDMGPLLMFVKDISVSSSDTGAAPPPPPAIPVGCVVVESRMPDGSRLTPQILELADVQLPERGENNGGTFHARILCSGGSSPSGGSDPNSDHEGSFSFPVLLPSSSTKSPEILPNRGEIRVKGLWRDPPLADLETPIKNRSIKPHPPPPAAPLPPPPPPPSSITKSVREREILEIIPSRYTVSDDSTSSDPRRSFSFDIEQTVTKRTHEIVLPTLPSRSLSPSPVFSPSEAASSSFRSVAAASPPILPPVQVPSIPYPPRARRSLNKKLKFYSLERASYAAAGSKRTKPPPSFNRQCRQPRKYTDVDSDSDLFEIETMSGTNAMGSSRTPPSTPTKSPSKVPPAAPQLDYEKLSDSIARVSRSRSKRNGNNSPIKSAPMAYRTSKVRCLPVERRRDSVFAEGGDGSTMKNMSQNSLKGRAMLKLGLLMRSSKQQYHSRNDRSRDSELYRSSETSASEYLENKPPSPGAQCPQGQCGQCVDEERAANHNYAFEWYCGSMAQRVAPLHQEKRQQQQPVFSYQSRGVSNEDRTFAVKN